MRFLDKYDLQEPITAGPLRLYEALEPESGLRRLIQILEWKEAPAEVSTLQVLEQFRQAAPDPPGIILDAGRVETTNQIYLVTSFPADPLSVQRWVNSYVAKSKAGAPVSTPVPPVAPVRPPVTPTPGAPRESEENAQPWTRHEPGAFTKEFLAVLDGSDKLGSTPPASPKPEITNEPGEFTREFMSLSASAPRDKEPAAPPTEAPGFFQDVSPGPATSASMSPIPKPMPDKKTGEFTRFFRGYSEAPSEPPASPFSPGADVLGTRAREPEASHDSPGEFTKMFKADFAAPPESQEKPITARFDPRSPRPTQPIRLAPDPLPQRPISPVEASPFREPVSRAPDSSANATPSFAPAWSGQTTPTPMPVSPATPFPRPPTESQPMPANSLEPAWREDKSGATRLMTPPAAQQPSPAPVSTGPSEFTRIISPISVPGGGPPPPGPSPAAAPPTQLPSMQPHLPPVPAPPIAMRTPVVPQAPAVPQVPPVPSLAAMPAPPPPAPAPQPGAPPSKLGSYLPLIITLNVLLLVAIAIVLYFALKPHH
jgi:hypothetical protein